MTKPDTMTAAEYRKRIKQKRGLENAFAATWKYMVQDGKPTYVREYKFAKKEMDREWRFDFAFVEQRVGIEIDGGTHRGGRHVRGKGYQSDCNKLNAAVCLNWAVLRYTSDDIMNRGADVIEQVCLVLNRRAPHKEAT